MLDDKVILNTADDNSGPIPDSNRHYDLPMNIMSPVTSVPTVAVSTSTGLMWMTGLAAAMLGVLALAEARVKLEAVALKLTLHQDTRSGAKVLLITCVQIALMAGLARHDLCTRELQVLCLYSVLPKLLLLEQMVMTSSLGLSAIAAFTLIAQPTSSFSVLESLDDWLTTLTLQFGPVLMLSILLLIPLIMLALLFISLARAAWLCVEMVVRVRRKYPTEFDFFVTLAISILMWKILKRDLRQLQKKEQSLICSDQRSFGVSLDEGRVAQHLSVSQAGLLGDTWLRWFDVDKVPRLSGATVQGSVDHPVSLESYLEFYYDSANNYRMINVLKSEVSMDGAACNLTVSYAPRADGPMGLLKTTIYQIYLIASWLIPPAYQSPLDYFGFVQRNLILEQNPAESKGDCTRFNKQIFLEKL